MSDWGGVFPDLEENKALNCCKKAIDQRLPKVMVLYGVSSMRESEEIFWKNTHLLIELAHMYVIGDGQKFTSSGHSSMCRSQTFSHICDGQRIKWMFYENSHLQWTFSLSCLKTWTLNWTKSFTWYFVFLGYNSSNENSMKFSSINHINLLNS